MYHRDGTSLPVRRATVAAVLGGLLMALSLWGQGCAPQQTTPAGPVEPVAQVTWDNTVGQLLAQECGGCHGRSGGLSLATYDDALKGGRRGPAITPGQGANSLLVRALRGTEPGLARMPANRSPLSEDQINLISGWIDAGAPK
ncbi:MAG: c-type cytochrome domain-containing protein [Anaerolineae bacterium]